jgi:hypothetical protein
VEYSAVPIPADAGDSLSLSFPGAETKSGAGTEALALLSFASRGDMKFGDPVSKGNRDAFLRDAGIDPTACLGLPLVHSRNVIFSSRADEVSVLASEARGADGLILRDPGLAASVTVADCMPIWILDRDSGAFGILHSGWRGTGILARAVDILVGRCGSRPSSIAVILGPAIGSCCYAVPEERAAAFSSEFGTSSVALRNGSWRIDLRAANIAIAERAGIGHLLSVEACTSCDPRLGSYRRQGAKDFTRMMAVCGHF